MKKGEAINDVGRSWLDNRRLADIYRMRESNRDVAKIVDKSLPRRTLQLVYGCKVEMSSHSLVNRS